MFLVDADSSDMSRATNHTTAGKLGSLRTFLSSKSGWVTFDAIRDGASGFEGSQDGVVHQACFDAGYNVEMF